MTLPSKNLSTVLWINLIGAVIASGVLLSTRLASKVEVPGIQKGRKVGKNTNKTANKRLVWQDFGCCRFGNDFVDYCQ